METTITSTTELPEETTTDHPRDTTSTTPTSEMSTIPQTTAGTESTEHDLPFYDIEWLGPLKLIAAEWSEGGQGAFA
mgnify:CR=1 FL=1